MSGVGDHAPGLSGTETVECGGPGHATAHSLVRGEQRRRLAGPARLATDRTRYPQQVPIVLATPSPAAHMKRGLLNIRLKKKIYK